MNEILEILNDLENDYDRDITLEEINLIRDYITKLHAELKELRDDYSIVVTGYKKLKDKNKAITAIKKYIKENEKEFGSLLENEKTILRIIDGE